MWSQWRTLSKCLRMQLMSVSLHFSFPTWVRLFIIIIIFFFCLPLFLFQSHHLFPVILLQRNVLSAVSVLIFVMMEKNQRKIYLLKYDEISSFAASYQYLDVLNQGAMEEAIVNNRSVNPPLYMQMNALQDRHTHSLLSTAFCSGRAECAPGDSGQLQRSRKCTRSG